MRLSISALLLGLMLGSGGARAQSTAQETVPGYLTTTGCAAGTPCFKPGGAARYTGELAMTVGTAYPALQGIKANCTAAGNVAVTYADGSIGTWIVVVGTNTIPVGATAVNTAGTTATCTYAELR